MKNNLVKTCFILFGLMAIITISALSFSPKTYAIERPGHWEYDALGQHCGCKSPGNDCTWNEQKGV